MKTPTPRDKCLDSKDPRPINTVLAEMLGEAGQVSAPPCFTGFTAIGEVGRGSFGTVYRARDEKLGREVAIKIISGERAGTSAVGDETHARERFLAEARALASVRHPNVLNVYAVLEERGHFALVTELIVGEPLSEVLEGKGPLSAEEAAHVGVEVCRALAAVHAAGIVHRDVKTQNVLREKGGRIVLLDFGLGSYFAEGREPEAAGALAGSPLFIAPETLRGQKPGRGVDLYALGMMLYNLSTGKFPVMARSLRELFERVKVGDLTPIRDVRPDIPQRFASIVTRALATNPSSRYSSAGDMEAALLECVGGRRKHRMFGRWVAPAALLIAVAVAVLALRPDGESFHVEALASRAGKVLSDGDRIAVGEGISLELKCDRPFHLYVLNEDDSGTVNVLFPRADVPIHNPLPPGKACRIPGGEGWEVTSVGGEERLLLMGSLEPLKELEEAIAHDKIPREVALRGITRLKKLSAGKQNPVQGPLSDLLEEMKRAQGGAERVSGLWLRKFTFRNP